MSGEESFHSVSLSSSQSKSLGSSEGLSHSSALSSPETDTKQSTIGSTSRSRGSDSPGRASITEYPLKTLGMLKNLYGHGEGPLDVIKFIDVAQQEESLPFVADGDDVLLSVSAYGLLIATSTPRMIIHRIPLHEIERIVTFDDGICGNTLLAIKLIEFDKSRKEKVAYSLFVYQCFDEEVGQKITSSFSRVLDQVLSSRMSASDASLDVADERAM